MHAGGGTPGRPPPVACDGDALRFAAMRPKSFLLTCCLIRRISCPQRRKMFSSRFSADFPADIRAYMRAQCPLEEYDIPGMRPRMLRARPWARCAFARRYFLRYAATEIIWVLAGALHITIIDDRSGAMKVFRITPASRADGRHTTIDIGSSCARG